MTKNKDEQNKNSKLGLFIIIGIVLVLVVIGIILMLLPGKENNKGLNDDLHEEQPLISKEGDRTLKVVRTDYFTDGMMPVENDDDKCGYMDVTGKVVIDYQYDSCSDFQNGYATVKKDDEYFLIDNKNKIVNKWKGVSAYLENDLVKIYSEEKYGVTDFKGKVIIPAEYESIKVYEKFIEVEKNDKYAIFDRKGKQLTEFAFDYVEAAGDRIVVELDDKYALFTVSGKQLTEFKYDELFYNELVGAGRVCIDDLCGVIDANGKEVTEINYKELGYFTKDGKVSATKDEKVYGFVDTKGKESDFQYSLTESYVNGYATVCNKDELCGVIDKNGKLVVDYKYEAVLTFTEDGVAFAVLDGKFGVIDAKGKVLVDFLYDGYFSFVNGFGYLYKEDDSFNKTYAIVNSKGKLIAPAIFDEVSYFHSGLANVCIDDECGFINIEGKMILGTLDIDKKIKEQEDKENEKQEEEKRKEELEEFVGYYAVGDYDTYTDYIYFKDDNTYDRQVNNTHGFEHLYGDYEFVTKNEKKYVKLSYDNEDLDEPFECYMEILSDGSLKYDEELSGKSDPLWISLAILLNDDGKDMIFKKHDKSDTKYVEDFVTDVITPDDY